jgi:hypothetical protein
MQVNVSMGGIRIVQDSRGEHAEFQVQMVIEDYLEISNWKSFSDFEVLATALHAFIVGPGRSSPSWMSFFAPQKKHIPRKLSLYNFFDAEEMLLKRSLSKALIAWEDVVSSHGWSWFRRLSMTHLIEECRAIDRFLQQVLFEIPNPELLIEFIRT